MRTDNSIKNSITAFFANGLSFLIAFIAQAIFINQLGTEYLGLNGLFTNVLTIISFFELGIGNAIVYNLYKPIAKGDCQKISALMNFYKKSYHIIAFLIFLFGIMMLPFVSIFVHDVTVDINIYAVYLLFLMSTVTSYLMTYKRNLIIAHQQNYIINIIHMIYVIALNTLQLLIVIFTKNYYLYLIIKISCQWLENIIISIIANGKFKAILENSDAKLDINTRKDISSRVKALFFHKIGSVVISGTDNIIISSFFGIVTVGLYSNYYIITNGVTTLFSQIIQSTTASVGNLMVCDDGKKVFNTFKNIRFINFWISSFTAICLLMMIDPFISIWVGQEFLFSFDVLIVLVFNYFQKMQRQSYSTFKDAAGIWREDKYVPLVESVLNIIFSIILLKIFGLAGVFLGTIISGFALWFYSYPKYVYKKVFERSYLDYAKETLGYILLFIFMASITYSFTFLIPISNSFIQLIIYGILSLIIPNIIMCIVFINDAKFKYIKYILYKTVKKYFFGKKEV